MREGGSQGSPHDPSGTERGPRRGERNPGPGRGRASLGEPPTRRGPARAALGRHGESGERLGLASSGGYDRRLLRLMGALMAWDPPPPPPPSPPAAKRLHPDHVCRLAAVCH